MKKRVFGFLAGAGLLAAVTVAGAAGLYTNGLPVAGGTQYPSTLPLTGNETIAADTNLTGGQNPATEAITTTQLAGYSSTLAGTGGFRNALIGGDFGTNLWQRGTSGTATTTVLTYGPDRWWALSGTSTEVKIIKETGASDITAGFAASARLQRTASQTGVVASCIGQVLTSANSTRLQGQKVEFSFWGLAGALFSAANSQVTVTIAYGTGSDESAANFSTGAWTGYTAAVAQATTLSTSWARYSAVATIPVTATQVGVKICFTPVGTAGATDFFEIAGAQLDVNPAAVAYNGTAGTASNMASFDAVPASVEAIREYAYFFRLSEPASGAALPATCQATGATANICNVILPVPMRATTPTITITAAGTFAVNIAGTPTTIVSPTASTCSSTACAVTAGNTNTAGQAELLTGAGGTGKWDVSAEL